VYGGLARGSERGFLKFLWRSRAPLPAQPVRGTDRHVPIFRCPALGCQRSLRHALEVAQSGIVMRNHAFKGVLNVGD
jgi:hypothetical protein